jgi:hypothetical protein
VVSSAGGGGGGALGPHATDPKTTIPLTAHDLHLVVHIGRDPATTDAICVRFSRPDERTRYAFLLGLTRAA